MIVRQVRAVQALNTVVDPGGKVVFLSPPGYFCISLTATDEMVERSLPVFARAIERARSGHALPAAPV